MKIFDFFQKNKGVATIGFVLTLLGFATSIYVDFLRKEHDISFDIVDQIDVFEIRQNFPALTLTYQGQDLIKNDLNLKILKVRVVNSGSEPIRANDLDATVGWGVEVKNGQLVDAQAVEASSEYVKGGLARSIRNENRLQFPALVLDPQEYFVYQLVVLDSRKVPSVLLPFGKIAGIAKLKMESTWKEEQVTAPLSRVFSGGLAIQTVRTIAYFFMFIIVFLIVILVTAILGLIVEKTVSYFRSRGYRSQLLNHGYAFHDARKYAFFLGGLDKGSREVLRKLASDSVLRERVRKRLGEREPGSVVVKVTIADENMQDGTQPSDLHVKHSPKSYEVFQRSSQGESGVGIISGRANSPEELVKLLEKLGLYSNQPESCGFTDANFQKAAVMLGVVNNFS